MNETFHQFSELFAQLGLPNEEADIRRFVATHSPLPEDMRLADAPFWTESQSRCLAKMLQEDADWAPVVDQLNIALRAPRE